MDRQPPDLVFVGGPERSGTTLLQNMLDSHPDIAGAPEFMHLPQIVELRNEMHHTVEHGWTDLFGAEDEVDASVRDFVLDFFGRFRENLPTRATTLAEKTPANVMVFEELLGLFDGALCLFIVRDPRAVVASILEVGRRAREQGRDGIQDYTQDLRKAIRLVKRRTRAGFRALEREPGRIRLVRYEDLVRHPERETREICDFLSHPWSPGMLRPDLQEHPGEDALVNDVWYDRETYYSAPDPSRIDRWKERLTATQKVEVGRAFAGDPDLRELGYDLAADDLSPPERTVGAAVHLGRRLARAGVRRLGS